VGFVCVEMTEVPTAGEVATDQIAANKQTKPAGFEFILQQSSFQQSTEALSVPNKKELFLSRALARIDEALISATKVIGQKRDQILEELFHDVTAPLEDDILSFCGLPFDSDHPPCYFELLAEEYQRDPKAFNKAYQSCLMLWNNLYHPILFAALFYRVVVLESSNGADGVKHMNEIRRGANRLFWIDVRRHTNRFRSIYQFLKEQIVLQSSRWIVAAIGQNALAIFGTVARFFFYYEHASKLPEFLRLSEQQLITFRLENSSAPVLQQTSLFGTTLRNCALPDVVVVEVADLLYILKDQTLLIDIITNMTVLKDIRFRDLSTLLKLQSVLYNISAPGGPFYAPRDVRVAARKTMEVLFPRGNISRTLTYLAFRLTHPYYATKSFAHFLFRWLMFWLLLIFALFWRWPKSIVRRASSD